MKMAGGSRAGGHLSLRRAEVRPSEQTASTRAGLGGRRRPPRGRTMKGQRPVGRPSASEGGAPFTGRRTSLESGRLCLGVLAMLLGGLACSSPPKGPAPVDPSQLLLRLASHTELTVAKMPNQVYLFPPLLCDAEGKPEQAWDKIVEGRLTGWFRDTVLLEQGLHGDKTSVADVLNGGSIERFTQAYLGA